MEAAVACHPRTTLHHHTGKAHPAWHCPTTRLHRMVRAHPARHHLIIHLHLTGKAHPAQVQPATFRQRTAVASRPQPQRPLLLHPQPELSARTTTITTTLTQAEPHTPSIATRTSLARRTTPLTAVKRNSTLSSRAWPSATNTLLALLCPQTARAATSSARSRARRAHLALWQRTRCLDPRSTFRP